MLAKNSHESAFTSILAMHKQKFLPRPAASLQHHTIQYMHARLLNFLDSSQLAPKCDEHVSVENDDES